MCGVFERVKKGNYLIYLCLSFANKLRILIFCNALCVKVPGNISQRFVMFLFLCFSLSLLTFFPLFLTLPFPSCWQQHSFISHSLFPGFPFHCPQYIPFFMECKHYEDCAFLGIIFIYYLYKVSHSSETRALLCMSTKIKRRAVRLSG